MFKTKAMMMALALAGGVTGQAAHAQMQRDRMEKAQDRQEMRQDGRQTMDDRMDLAKLEATLAEFDQHRAAGRMGPLVALDRRVMELMREEAFESRAETMQKANEVRRDGAEVRSDGRELRRDAYQAAPAGGDRRDLRDDRRDMRDDRRDLGREMGQNARRHQIAQEYRGLMGRQDPASLDRKRTLLVELVGIARNELRGDHQEMREDRRELREDRRETREDRRDGMRR